MPSRKRTIEAVEPEDDAPIATSPLLTQIRNSWYFACLMQFIYFFGASMKIDNDLDVEMLEEELVKPYHSEKLSELGLTLLKWVSSHRGLNLDIFDEYTRRQFVAKAPDRNPYGTDDDPNKFSEFDVFTKLRVLHQLTVWTFWNPDRIRERMAERDETQWRIEPLGWDSKGRTYFILDDNRLYMRTDLKPTVAKKPAKASKAKSRSNRRSSKRQKLNNQKKMDEDEVNGQDESEMDPSAVDTSEDGGLGGGTWECLAISFQEYTAVLESLQSKNQDEKELVHRIRTQVLPDIEKVAEAQERKEAKRRREMENLQRMAGAKRSSRIADKAQKQKAEDDAAEAERKRKEDIVMALKEQARQKKMEEDRESRMMTREQRLKDREMKRVLQEQELAKLEAEDSSNSDGHPRGSQRHRLAQIERKQREVSKLKQELSQPDEHWDFDCSICGVHGKDLDDGTHILACENCNVWQHSACHGIKPHEAERDDFHFLCASCKKPKVNSIKINYNEPSLSQVNGPQANPSLPAYHQPQAWLNNVGALDQESQPVSPRKDAALKISHKQHHHHSQIGANDIRSVSGTSQGYASSHQNFHGYSQGPPAAQTPLHSSYISQTSYNPYHHQFSRQPPTTPSHFSPNDMSNPMSAPSTPALSATQGNVNYRFSPSANNAGSGSNGSDIQSSPNAPSYSPASNKPNPAAVSPTKQSFSPSSPSVGAPVHNSGNQLSATATVNQANANQMPNNAPQIGNSNPHYNKHLASGQMYPQHSFSPMKPQQNSAVAKPDIPSQSLPNSLPPGPSLSPSVNIGPAITEPPTKKATPEESPFSAAQVHMNGVHSSVPEHQIRPLSELNQTGI